MKCQSVTGHANGRIMSGGIRVLAITAFLMSIAQPCQLLAASSGKDFHQAALKALQRGDAERAVELFSKALELNPREYRYYNDRGIAYRRSGNLKAARADYTKALELKPDYTNALNNRGIVYLQQGLHDKAATDFTEALKHGGLEGKIHTNRGMARAAKGDHKGAIEDFEKALSFPPVDTRSFLLMARSLEEAGAGEKALKMYQLAKGLAKDSEAAALIERKIAELDKGHGAATRMAGKPKSGKPGSETGVSRTTPRAEPRATRKAVQSRTVVQAPPRRRTDRSLPGASRPIPSTPAENLKDLNGRLRKKAGEKYSPVAREIFRQGLQFMEKSDANKALVRFEDTRQLERRKKNYYSVAWSDLEIGRSYAAMQEYLKAAPYLEEALRVFKALKAGDETVLTLVELAAVSKAIGHNDRSARLYGSAREQASALGHQALSRVIGDIAAGRPVQSKVTRADAATGMQTSRLSDEPHRAGRKALQWGKKDVVRAAPRESGVIGTQQSSERRTDEESRPAKITLWAQSHSSPDRPQSEKKEAAHSQKSPAPETTVGTVPVAEPVKTASVPVREPNSVSSASADIQSDLKKLRELRENNAESEMIAVLERLADKYSRKRDYDRALYSMTASLALREKLRFGKGQEGALERAATIKERLGRSAEALEDMTRALALARADRKRTERELETRSKKLAAALGLEPDKALAVFENFWKSRNSGNSLEETEALHSIGRLFEAADRPAEALKYFDRSFAGMLADKARVYRKAGKTQDAERLHEQALQMFKDLDYSRYMQMLRRAEAPNTASRR